MNSYIASGLRNYLLMLNIREHKPRVIRTKLMQHFITFQEWNVFLFLSYCGKEEFKEITLVKEIH